MKAPITSRLTLDVVAEHFAQWRSRKKKRERIPEALWREAIGLLDTYQISQVTRTLRLSGADLNKRRGIDGAGQRRKDVQIGAAFVEIDHLEVAQVTELNAAVPWLEAERPDGVRLRIHPGGSTEWLALVDRFMRS